MGKIKVEETIELTDEELDEILADYDFEDARQLAAISRARHGHRKEKGRLLPPLLFWSE